jgi:hypothetical protein
MEQIATSDIPSPKVNNCIRTTVEELRHFGLWGKYCHIMNIDCDSESPDEQILLPEELMEMLGI